MEIDPHLGLVWGDEIMSAQEMSAAMGAETEDMAPAPPALEMAVSFADPDADRGAVAGSSWVPGLDDAPPAKLDLSRQLSTFSVSSTDLTACLDQLAEVDDRLAPSTKRNTAPTLPPPGPPKLRRIESGSSVASIGLRTLDLVASALASSLPAAPPASSPALQCLAALAARDDTSAPMPALSDPLCPLAFAEDATMAAASLPSHSYYSAYTHSSSHSSSIHTAAAAAAAAAAAPALSLRAPPAVAVAAPTAATAALAAAASALPTSGAMPAAASRGARMRIKIQVYDMKPLDQPIITRNARGAEVRLRYQCPVDSCKRAFRGRSELVAHIRTHTQEKPLQCTTCGARFAHCSNLRSHERLHSGSKPYTCPHPGCSAKFAQACTMKEHARTHSGARPFACDKCGATFAHSSNFYRHKRSHK